MLAKALLGLALVAFAACSHESNPVSSKVPGDSTSRAPSQGQPGGSSNSDTTVHTSLPLVGRAWCALQQSRPPLILRMVFLDNGTYSLQAFEQNGNSYGPEHPDHGQTGTYEINDDVLQLLQTGAVHSSAAKFKYESVNPTTGRETLTLTPVDQPNAVAVYEICS